MGFRRVYTVLLNGFMPVLGAVVFAATAAGEAPVPLDVAPAQIETLGDALASTGSGGNAVQPQQ